MPEIRYRVEEFTNEWNWHYISRNQRRPHVVPGKPWNLYNLTKEPVQNQGFIPNQDLVKTLKQATNGWGKVHRFFYQKSPSHSTLIQYN